MTIHKIWREWFSPFFLFRKEVCWSWLLLPERARGYALVITPGCCVFVRAPVCTCGKKTSNVNNQSCLGRFQNFTCKLT